MQKKYVKALSLWLVLIMVMSLGACKPLGEENNKDTVNLEEQEVALQDRETQLEVLQKELEAREQEIIENEQVLFALDADLSEKEEELFVREEAYQEDRKSVEGVLFDQYMDELGILMLESSPLSATFNLADLDVYGLNYLKGELDSQNLDDLDELILEAEGLVDELETFDRNNLSHKQQMNYDLADFDLKASLALSQFKYIGSTLDPNGGVHINIPLSLMQQELNNKEDVELFIQRVSELDRLFDECIVYEEIRLEEGYALPSTQYEDVVEQITSILEKEDGTLNSAKEYMMYLSFEDKLNEVKELTADEKMSYLSTYEAIIQDEIYPGLDRLKVQATKMAEESTNDGNLCDTPEGKAYYEAFIKVQTFNELNVEELRVWAEAEMQRVMTGFTMFSKKYPDFFERDIMGEFPEYDSFDELYTLVDQIYADQFFSYDVEKADEFVIPEYLQEHMPPGFYFPISADGGAYGNMYLTQETYDNPTIDTFITYAHENIPGHHLYFTYIADSDEPLYRKMTGYNSYVEGWAKHVENIAFQYVGWDEAMVEFFELNGDYSNASSVLTDIKFHYDGISFEEAVSDFVNLGYDQETAELVVERMMISPAETVHYMYGAYKMKQFEQEFMDNKGDNFDIREYHDFILSHYGLPFYTVEEELRDLLGVKAN